MDAIRYLWYDFWGYGTIEIWLLAIVGGCYLIKWAVYGLPRYKKRNDNIYRNFWDYM